MRTVALVLAVGLSVALNLLAAAALVVVIWPHDPLLTPRIGEYLSSVLLGWGGGMIGILGTYAGYALRERMSRTP